MSVELFQARDAVWDALGRSPFRRKLLGRQRCDAIVRVAMDSIVPIEMNVSGPGTDQGDVVILRIERRVRERYAEQCGFAFSTLILSWAISAIVQALVARWWKNRQEVQP